MIASAHRAVSRVGSIALMLLGSVAAVIAAVALITFAIQVLVGAAFGRSLATAAVAVLIAAVAFVVADLPNWEYHPYTATHTTHTTTGARHRRSPRSHA